MQSWAAAQATRPEVCRENAVTTTPPSATPDLAAQRAIAPTSTPAGAPAWLVPPEKRVAVVVPFLLIHLIVPYVNSLVTRALVDSVSRSELGLVLAVNSFLTRGVLIGLQAVVLRKYVPPVSWFLFSIAGTFVASLVELFVVSALYSAYGLSAFRVVGPTLWWLFLSGSQLLVWRSYVQAPWLWLAASVGAAFCAAFLLNTAAAAGTGAGVLIVPWIGLGVGAAQCWCLVHFIRTRADTAR